MKIDRFAVIMTLWMSLVLSILLSILLPIIANGSLTLPGFLEGFAVSFVISMVVSLVLPINALGAKLASALKAKPESLPWILTTTAGATLMMATIMTLCMVYYFLLPVPEAFRPDFIMAWLAVYPYAVIAVYVASLAATPVGVSIAKKFCAPPRAQAC